MRISDWSSDVCSSDLGEHTRARCADGVADRDRAAVDVDDIAVPAKFLADRKRLGGERLVRLDQIEVGHAPSRLFERGAAGGYRADAHERRIDAPRSEEHTSELQSLMRNSSAVF